MIITDHNASLNGSTPPDLLAVNAAFADGSWRSSRPVRITLSHRVLKSSFFRANPLLLHYPHSDPTQATWTKASRAMQQDTRPRQIFITGTAGFIGFHLAKLLLAEGFVGNNPNLS